MKNKTIPTINKTIAKISSLLQKHSALFLTKGNEQEKKREMLPIRECPILELQMWVKCRKIRQKIKYSEENTFQCALIC